MGGKLINSAAAYLMLAVKANATVVADNSTSTEVEEEVCDVVYKSTALWYENAGGISACKTYNVCVSSRLLFRIRRR